MDNETLTQSMLDNLPAHLRAKRSGKYIRAGCPFHGSTSQRSLSINTETGRFSCFSCGVWGYTEESKQNYKPNNLSRSQLTRRKITTTKPVTLDLAGLTKYQANLAQGRDYLASRNIPFKLAQQLGAGVGKLAGATRLILPHTNPQDEVVSLYGRRIDGGAEFKHYHLKRPKGIFNAQAMANDDVWITEGAFDCLALIASGIPNSIAVFGLNGIRWDWLKQTRRIVLGFDIDSAGVRAIKEQAEQAQLRGTEVLTLTKEELGGANDIAEAWQKGTLNIQPLSGGKIARPPEKKEVQSNSATPPRTITKDPPSGHKAIEWNQYRDAARQIANEHLDELLDMGWSELEIFGFPLSPRAGGGIAWSLCDSEITRITRDKITVQTPTGSILNYYRHKNATKGLKMPYYPTFQPF